MYYVIKDYDLIMEHSTEKLIESVRERMKGVQGGGIWEPCGSMVHFSPWFVQPMVKKVPVTVTVSGKETVIAIKDYD